MKLIRKAGATSNIFQIFVQDSSSTTGAGLTGLVFNSGSLTAYYHRDTDTTATAITLVTMTVGTFTSSGFKEIDATNMPGWYQFCPPDAAIAASAKSCGLHLKGATNMASLPIEVQLVAFDPDDVVHLGLSALPNTAVTTNASLITSGSGTDQLTLSGGIASADAKKINAVSTSSVTTINANQGTTQPINFTGTAGSALAKSDMVDIAGSAVSTSSAQIGVNAVNIGGTAQTGRDLGASVLLSNGTGTGQISLSSGAVLLQATQTGVTIPTVTNLTNAPTAGDFTATMKTSLNAATPASVTGSVGSVTGAVGSVTGSVASVTGNVGGNVVGSVASVTAGVTVTTNNDKTGYALSATGSAALTESYATDGAAPTLNQILYQIQQFLHERVAGGTTVTVKKLDGTTSAMTFTINDATTPTSITRAT